MFCVAPFVWKATVGTSLVGPLLPKSRLSSSPENLLSPSESAFPHLIDAFSQRTGIELKARHGTCAFLDEHGAYWQISAGAGSEALVIERTMDEFSLENSDSAMRLLELNNRHALMRGASLGWDPRCREVRLIFLLPCAAAGAIELENVLINLLSVRDSILQWWGQLEAEAVSCRPDSVVRSLLSTV